MAEFPKKARVVVVGLGGIVGASVAHHLIERQPPGPSTAADLSFRCG